MIVAFHSLGIQYLNIFYKNNFVGAIQAIVLKYP
jgi:hypothetical protein